jgi:3-oxoacyl-[acyl-carrier protein] reductase
MVATEGNGGVAVVTGAGQGLGAAISRRLAADGYDVCVLDVNRETAATVAREIGGRAIHCDVADPESVLAAAAEAGQAEILVNNAGIWFVEPTLDSSFDHLSRVAAVNLLGTVTCSQAFAPAMIEQGHGSIVNLSSAASKTASPGFGLYPATKAAIETLTRQLALEWGPHGIRVNAVAPGLIRTEGSDSAYDGDRERQRAAGVPLRRTGVPADIADVVAQLCSDDMRYVTGQVIFVDGGITAGRAGV